MTQIYHKTLTTRHFDLDWNRHVTSRTYEKFAYDARCEVLRELGFPMERMLNEGISLSPNQSYVRFLNQQFTNSDITVETQVFQMSNSSLFWKQTLFGQDGKKACEMESISTLIQKEKIVPLTSLPNLQEMNLHQLTIRPMPVHQNKIEHDYYIPYSEMNCFWILPADAIWKIFEEGRFLFFKEIVDFQLIKETDSTTFFMGGEIKIYHQPNPGSNVKLYSWIESFEKIRFYFRQDIIDANGTLIASMKDEQLFVSLFNSRPKRAPAAFFEKIERFIE
ncbi:acyl-[acyl-carrier-protein] thioesterase [Leptospira kemamanensis]|uniref:Acyl-[acyl-carrier-protein] thioesterase n=1 Tax=Leptospira kemamanensis TaxID=2484942 RepID=A0A4R9JPF3_9LEPT|nr:acyl-[acyl-carrier-protein] thioesterase [Leptospira kemamanensis]TGL52987.1 acyl-[acyl-carrier-protein] thioesterase [Leptospira kemamanensis]